MGNRGHRKQAGTGRRSAVPLVPLEAGSCDGVHDPVLVDAAEVAVAGVGDDDPSPRIDGDIVRIAQTGLGRRAPVAPVRPRAVAGHRADEAAGGIDSPDSLVEEIGEVDVAVRSHPDSGGGGQESLFRRLAVVDAGSAQGGGHDTCFPVVPAQPPGAVAPEHGAVRVGEDAGLDRVADRLGTVQTLLAPSGNPGAHQRPHDAGVGVGAADAVTVLFADVQVVPHVEADGVGHQGAGPGRPVPRRRWTRGPRFRARW